MNDSKISVRYAKALFESALEKKKVDEIYRDMAFILETSKLQEMKDLLESQIIKPSKKIEILSAVLGDRVNELTFSMVEMAVKNGRENFLPGIARVFIHDTKEYKGITESVLTTALKVDPAIRQQVIDFISTTFSTKVEMKELVDPSIVGGFILRIEDNYVDASVKKKLRKIEKELRANSLNL